MILLLVFTPTVRSSLAEPRVRSRRPTLERSLDPSHRAGTAGPTGLEPVGRKPPTAILYSPSGWRTTKPEFSGRSGRQRGPGRLEGSLAGLVSRRTPAT